MNNNRIFPLVMAFFVAGCAGVGTGEIASIRVLPGASAGPMTITQARVLTDNDAAFQSKLKLIRDAASSLDLVYYIFSDDYSSSVLAEELLAAAKRGVRVRLLVDYHTNYKRLDFFSALERLAEKEGKARLEVRFYNRPTRQIVMDAAYMTMGCGREGGITATARPADCSRQKLDALAALFAAETVGGEPAEKHNVSNINTGGSGVFLSGLYGKRPDVMALAVQEGQQISADALRARAPASTPESQDALKRVSRTYWRSRTGSAFEKLGARLELLYISAAYGDQLGPVRDIVFGALPLERELGEQQLRDWDHLTDFTHHKLLLADSARLQLGGRNVEDSYHMRANRLIDKYVFMDTDLVATVAGGGEGLAESFERLWGFRDMVATLPEVRAHAPNDIVANLDAFHAAEQACAKQPVTRREACVDGEFRRTAQGLDERINLHVRDLERKARRYRTEYAPGVRVTAEDGLSVDASARLSYFENLHFDKNVGGDRRQRLYGAPSGREGASGKYIHEYWLAALRGVCDQATRERPRTVILHNAYFMPPANMTAALSELAEGGRDCSNVTVKVLTNSIQTTDLNVVNLFARHVIKAFTERVEASDPARRARFEYHEYRPVEGERLLSLHSKVSVIGDDVLVGSANADARSLVMDTNNAMLLQDVPALRQEYVRLMDWILADPRRAVSAGEAIARTPRARMVEEDVLSLRQILAKYRADVRLSPKQLELIETRFKELLELAYTLTKQSIDPAATDEQRRDARDRFNDLFKTI